MLMQASPHNVLHSSTTNNNNDVTACTCTCIKRDKQVYSISKIHVHKKAVHKTAFTLACTVHDEHCMYST